MDLINRKFPQIQGLPLSTPQLNLLSTMTPLCIYHSSFEALHKNPKGHGTNVQGCLAFFFSESKIQYDIVSNISQKNISRMIVLCESSMWEPDPFSIMRDNGHRKCLSPFWPRATIQTLGGVQVTVKSASCRLKTRLFIRPSVVIYYCLRVVGTHGGMSAI